MRKLLRVFGWFVAILASIPVLIYFGLVLANLKDDTLSIEVEKLISTPPQAIKDSTNAYFAWVGIAAPEDQDSHSWGKRWYQEVLLNDKQGREIFPAPEFSLNKEKRKEPQEYAEIPCNKIETCLEAVAANPEAARQSLQKGRVTMERGDQALTYPAYQEPWRPDNSISSVIIPYPIAWSKLSATRFALAVAEGRHEEALIRLSSEIGFLIRQMQGSSSLVDKLVGFANMRQRYLLISQYLRSHPAEARKHAGRIAGMLTVMPDEAVSLQPCMRSEKRIGAIMLLSMKNQKLDLSLLPPDDGNESYRPSLLSRLTDYLSRPLWLVNSTINAMASRYDAWMRVDDFKGDTYRQALSDVREGPFRQQPYTIRNPVGNILVNISPDYSPYFMKRDELLALRSLIEFQFELMKSRTTGTEAVTRAIKENQNRLRHPFTNALPIWDKDKRRLSYPSEDQVGKNMHAVIQL